MFNFFILFSGLATFITIMAVVIIPFKQIQDNFVLDQSLKQIPQNTATEVCTLGCDNGKMEYESWDDTMAKKYEQIKINWRE